MATKPKADAPEPETEEAPEADLVAPEPAPEPDPVNTIDAGPPPITPSSSASQHEARIGFENDVNARAEDFLAGIRVQVIEALLQGGTVELTVNLPDDEGPVAKS